MVITPNALNPFDPSTHLPKPHLRPPKTLFSNPPLPPPFPRHAVFASNLRRRQRAKLCAKPTALRITACKASSSTSTSSNAVGEDAESAFEKLKEAERERINSLEEFERKANVQLERQLVLASEWSRKLLTMHGKLRGTEWDPENSHRISYSDFQRLLNSNNVQFMEYSNYGQTVSVILPYYKDGIMEDLNEDERKEVVFRRHIVDRMPVDCWNDVWRKLHQQLVNVDVYNVKTVPFEVYSTVAVAVVWSMRLALAVALYIWIDNKMRPIYGKLIPCDLGPPSKKKNIPIENRSLGSLGKSRAKFISAEEKTGVTFDDFAGQEYIKRELQEIVRILKNEEEFRDKGIYCPKGVLLHGPPGTGKTLLAKAIAGEAGLPFFAASGTDFVEMFVGVAASRVKDLFSSARSYAPSIIFIDEIDAIGSKRGGPDIGGGGAEREQGLLQILTELDGFKVSTSQVLVIGATNRLDILDPALLRKGRFDKIIRVGLPSKDGRLAILKVHARNKFFRSEEEKETLLQEIAEKTEDFTGAELQNILNEAGILTTRKDSDYIGREELLEALKRQMGTFETGQEDSTEVPEELKLRLAYREAAVAVVACYIPDPYRPFTETDVNSIRNQPNMQYTEKAGRVFKKKSDYVNAIVRACAPRVIEEEMFGVDNLCWISANATLEASRLAEVLILQTGMTALGKAYYRYQRDLVPNLAAKVEVLRDEYIRFAVEKCTSILKENQAAVEAITDVLLEKGEIKADEIWSIYKNYPRVPQVMGSGKVIGSAAICGGLYILKNTHENKQVPKSGYAFNSGFNSVSVSNESLVMLWHFRLGHPNFTYLERLFPGLFTNKRPNLFHCEVCQLAKHTRSTYSSNPYKPSQPFSVIHSDIWGPSRVNNVSGSRWFVSFIDDHTRTTWTFLMKEKSETASIFKAFHSMIQNQFKQKIQILKTDNGKEYFNSILGPYLLDHGIVHISSCVDTPQQNGVAERKNRHLLEVSRSIMFSNHVPKHFWRETVLTATYLINHMPRRVLKFKTPRPLLVQAFPHLSVFNSELPLKIFGCTAFVHIYDHKRTKLDPKSHKCIFIGYSSTQKGYKCYSPSTRRVYHTLDVTFFEHQSFFPKSGIQGENSREYQLWETLQDNQAISLFPNVPSYQHQTTLTQPNLSSPSSGFPPSSLTQPNLSPPSSSFPLPFQSDVTPENMVCHPPSSLPTVNPPSPLPNLPPQSPLEERNKELRVYRRRKFENIEANIQSKDCSSTHPSSLDLENHEGMDSMTNELVSITVDNLDLPIAHRKGTRTCTSHPIERYVAYGKLTPMYRAFVSSLDLVQIPTSIYEALRDPKWKVAIDEEINALEKNGTWVLVDLPQGKHAVGCKWIFTIKYNPNGSINRFKARLVAKGFTQSYGVDYQETFAPVAKLNTVRVLLSLAVNCDWPLYQLDVKNAFLNGELEEEVYMEIPPGFEKNSSGRLVCKLKKALYGLKQSPRAWFDRFAKSIVKVGYTQCQADHTLFVKISSTGKLAILIVYVDDIILTGDDSSEISNLKRFLASEFEIKDLGSLKYFLGMEVARSKEGIVISQRKYILDLLNETGMLGSKPADTPMDPNLKTNQGGEPTPVERGSYQRLVGKLIYLSHTRPDIAFPVSIVNQHMHNPNEEHLEAVYRILRYLKMTPGLGLHFRKHGNRDLEVYTDSSWAGELTDRRSVSGYCTYVWGNLVTWRSKKQSVVSRSSAESEYRALALGICEGMWIKRLLNELKIEVPRSFKMHSDSQAAISIAKNPVHHDRTKHVEIDRHFIYEKINSKTIELNYIPTKKQIADIFTKALPRTRFEEFNSKLGLYNIYNSA